MFNCTLRSVVTTVFSSTALMGLLSGCALQTTAVSSPDPVAGTAISGAVHGGSQPIFGAKIYLLAVNPTGYGGPGIASSAANASVSLLKVSATGNTADSIGSYVLTDSTTGAFSLSGDYTCTSGFAQSTAAAVSLTGTEQVYLYVLGGTPQLIGSTNASSGMLVALGPCNAPSTKVVVNEITTVATAYAFAGFATDATHIGSSGTALAIADLSNAYADVANLAHVSSGTPSSNSTSMTIVPSANLTTIANILAACVNGTTANSQCGTLFQYTASSGATGSAPTDTATAAINLAHNPWPTDAGMAALWGLVPGTGAPFTGGLAGQPTDFTLGLKITDGVLRGALGIAIDGSGNVWVSSLGAYMSEFSNNGVPVTGPNGTGYLNGRSGYGSGAGFDYPANLAIDVHGYVYATNYGSNTFSLIDPNGNTVINNGFTIPANNEPYGLAIDASNNVWMANSATDTVAEYASKYSNGSESVGEFKSPYGGYTAESYLFQPLGLAIDVSGHVWVADSEYNYLTELSSTGTLVGHGPYGGGGLTDPYGIAIDPSGNIWAANFSNRLSEFTSTGTPITSGTGYAGGGLNQPWHLAIDSAGNVWVPNSGANSISEFSNSGTPLSSSSGFTGGGLYQPYSLAIDGSGNIWVANLSNWLNSDCSSSYSCTTYITKLIGAASPVVTPVVANLIAPYGTSAVNRP